jgi:DMSO/TMAO reductase YedYZ heme-binding membrane subunit
MIWTLHWIRKILYGMAVVFAILIYLVITNLYPSSSLQTIRLVQAYALTAIILLYITLLISPLYAALPHLPYKPVVVKSRQALGVSAFGFGLIHSSLAFWGLLGGFEGIWFLSDRYIQAISISFAGLVILALLALTSIPPIMAKMGAWWKRIHRLVYVAALLLLIHLLLLGSSFSDLSTWIPQVFLAAVIVLVLLELHRLDAYLQIRFTQLPKFGLSLLSGSIGLGAAAVYLFAPAGAAPSLGIHAAHIQLALQAQQQANAQPSSGTANIPGLVGDRTKRYTVSFDHDAVITSNTNTTITFRVNDASSGNPTQVFQTLYEKQVHLIVVDSQLQYFTHIHPTVSGPTFSITTQFPHDGVYHLYADFQPFGAIEQQFGFSLVVGPTPANQTILSTQEPDRNLTKEFGDVKVALRLPGSLKASDLTLGRQLLSFTLSNKTDNTPLTNLQPYLGAYGHLVMINEQTYDYIHVHPNALANGPHGGPEVQFLPIGIYGPIKPGVYRAFAQFNPDGNLFTADFTVTVQ